MSKKQTKTEWDKLSPEGRAQAVAAIPAFKAWIKTQTDYRVLHACRFLSQRRFEGFSSTETARYSPEEMAAMQDRADRLMRRGKYAETEVMAE